MDVLYPNLHERFEREGLCPICLMEMELAPRYGCDNGHTVCHRCKPYYYACPTCRSPLELIPVAQGSPFDPPPPCHFIPHPMPRSYPSAPPVNDFVQHERQAWAPPTPTEDQELGSCSYTHLGCWVKVPEHLREIHESRCQFRPHLEDEQLPTDLTHQEDELVECFYRVAGCNVRTSGWRMSIHQNYCIYKDKYEAMCNITESLAACDLEERQANYDDDQDPEEFVECRYRRYGCMVRMRRRRRSIHQEKCNYRKYHREEDDEENEEPGQESGQDDEPDPEERLPCRWAEQGCRVSPKRCRKEVHEEKCNYRMEECRYQAYGCEVMFPSSGRFAHEKNCEFAG